MDGKNQQMIVLWATRDKKTASQKIHRRCTDDQCMSFFSYLSLVYRIVSFLFSNNKKKYGDIIHPYHTAATTTQHFYILIAQHNRATLTIYTCISCICLLVCTQQKYNTHNNKVDVKRNENGEKLRKIQEKRPPCNDLLYTTFGNDKWLKMGKRKKNNFSLLLSLFLTKGILE